MAAATNTTTTPRKPFPDRTISRKRWGAGASTIRPSAGLNAKFASGWITGRSSGAEEHNEPPRQKTTGETHHRRSPEGSAALSGFVGRTAAGASSGRQASALCGAAPRPPAALRPGPRQARGRAAAVADQGSDRGRDRGREQHARRPLSRGALSRPVVLPYPARRPQRRAARERQARRQQGPAGRGAKRSHSAIAARYAQNRG